MIEDDEDDDDEENEEDEEEGVDEAEDDVRGLRVMNMPLDLTLQLCRM